jgi:peptidoglycan/xylan/chitin deacetylase (PgdA/CDA1 family)
MRRLRFLAVILVVIATLFVGRAEGRGAERVPVLVYHHLTPGEAAGGATMQTAVFAAQMAQLKAAGYKTISTGDLADWLAGRSSLPAKAVLISFDDGYASVYEEAWPILRAYGFKATVFIVSGQIGRTPGKFPHLTAAQMREMAASGLVEFQDHSFDAHRTIGQEAVLTVWSEAQIKADLVASQAAFAEAALPQPKAFAYPFGAWHERAVRQLRAAGYQLGFTGEAGFVQRGDDPLLLKRIVAYEGMRLE